MEIRTLRYFLAVAREENMTRAAEQLQPHLCRRTGHNAGVRGQRLQRLAGREDREPGRMGFRGVQRDHQ